MFELVVNYYNFRLRVGTGSSVLEWQTLENVIITGCRMSAVLYSLTMSILLKAAEVECRGPLSWVHQPLRRAYMDDLTVTTTFVTGGRCLLKGLEENMTRTRMNFKAAKSSSLVLKKRHSHGWSPIYNRRCNNPYPEWKACEELDQYFQQKSEGHNRDLA